jgi:4-hydroxybenzoate polyprenyltransferase
MSAQTQDHSRQTDGVPLCVDLDGTLIMGDLLVEGYLRCVKANFFYAVLALFWLLRGKAHLKAQIASRAFLEVALLPVHDQFLHWLRGEHRRGRRLVLCTAANATEATKISEHFGIFESVLSSDSVTNLSGAAKASRLAQEFGVYGFDYAGNELKDLNVWRTARNAIVVAPSMALQRRLKAVARVEQVFTTEPPSLSTWARALRVHQWAKNVLVFVPALASHTILDPGVMAASVLAFLWFGFCASGTYLINDLLDLDADRMHARKRARPLAAGTIPLTHGIAAALTLITGAFIGALLTLSYWFSVALLVYLAATLLYSFKLKRIAMVDALSLAGLYTVRVIAGGAAIAIMPTFWLLAFSMFVFLSLAMVKRYTELRSVLATGKSVAAGRGYTTDDLPLLLACGISSGFLSVLVLALYINVGANDLYRDPHSLWLLCPLLLYWVCRVWQKTHRGELHDDPVVFALRDKPSLFVAVSAGVLAWISAQSMFTLPWA